MMKRRHDQRSRTVGAYRDQFTHAERGGGEKEIALSRDELDELSSSGLANFLIGTTEAYEEFSGRDVVIPDRAATTQLSNELQAGTPASRKMIDENVVWVF